MNDDKLLTVDEVADIMRVSRVTVLRRIWSKQLGHVKPGKAYLIPASELQKHLDKYRFNAEE